MKSIYSLTTSELENYLIENNEKKYRAEQIINWLYIKRINSFNEMTNLKKELIEKLNNDFYFDNMKIENVQEDKLVSKYLIKLNDDNHVEAVLMNHDYGNSLCISTQVGCNMGCRFCESGRLKKIRNLDAGELVYQIMLIEKYAKTRISHIVVMGIGEPFDNYDNLIKFLSIINNPKGINLGSRHITVSTCGIVPKIKEFTKLKLQVNLAISLHAPNNEIRNKIMNINKVYKIEELMSAIKEYVRITNRRITFEYIMLDKVNDSIENAKELAHLIRGINGYVNLIPYNETENIIFKRSSEENINKFFDTLKKEGIEVTKRKEFGSKIDAACGQLRAKREGNL